ncbi:cytochrome c biogenesis protein CcsA [Flavivirga algicola]|uniref:Cytochrome c biogenesis protein CcsA n=1 Tax=Flavivirga algicola TaxID=2729136 RepID=A0ABX1S0J1_9FLAO|nr:cytochrome c biogenesis protein CcsA [Flavivirga algicola]NMH88760.1 cytochrome c biogenesis protein CcsA [Flavivirga algicola]
MQKLYKLFSSSSLALLLLLIFAIAMATATFVENDFGTATAWAIIYDAWWFEVVMLGLVISFVANIFKYKLLRKEKWATLLFHVAFIVIILGAAITRYASYGGIMRIREGASSNIVISDTNFLTATITDGTNTKTIKEKLTFSPISDNDFTIKTSFNDKPVIISYNSFIADAIPEVVNDDALGEPLLEMVVTVGNGRNTVYLKKGEIEKIGEHQHEIGFNSNKKGIINIIEKEGAFSIEAPHDLDFFIMSSQQAGKIVKDSLQAITLRTLYRDGDISFVPLVYHEKGKFQLKNASDKPKDNDKTKDDALIVNVSVDGEEQPANILYREGFLPTHHNLEVNGLQVVLSYGAGAIKTPFSIQLNDFQLERYPGSSSPSAYASEVTILDKDKKTPFRIFMNNVLDYEGYRFFQASYDTDEKGTVLSVNHDRLGTIVTYLGYLLMMLGMFFTLFGKTSRFQFINKKLKQLKKKTVVITCLLLLGFTNAFAQTSTDSLTAVVEKAIKKQEIDKGHADFFGRLLVQDLDGRIKPINTLASEFLRKISRKSKFSYPLANKKIELDANQTFLAMHMLPQIWQRVPIIKVDFMKTGTLFDSIPKGKNKLIAFTNLLNKDGNYLLTNEVEDANKKKPSERNEFDKEVLKIDERFNILYNVFIGNYLKIFPNRHDKNNTWFSYTHHFKDFPDEDAQFAKTIIPAYFKNIATNNYESAHEKLMYIKKYQEVLGAEVIPTPKRIEAELWYNKANINFWLFQVFFTLGFVLLILAIVKMFSKKKWIEFLNNTFIILTLISFLCFTGNILLRWYVAQHAPWSNGYEMLIFVAWVLVLCGLITFRKSDFSLPLSTLFSGALLFVSYLDWLSPEITNLMPVLKSYWLKIHVATIVSSYAPLALSAILGLMALLLLIFKTPKTKDIIEIKIKELTYINEIAMTIGLFVLAVGTFLGGIWANESWGRYWAWDPKETWALISIIVYAIVLHLRFVPKLNNIYVLNVASMFAFWSIIMTSFGVNYYLSGLHSYAAGDPLPIPVFVYVLAIFMIVVAIVAAVRNKGKQAVSTK